MAFEGRNPSNAKRSVGSPATVSATIAAHGPGTATIATPARAAAATSTRAGIAHQWRTRIADERDVVAAQQPVDDLRRPIVFVVLVQRFKRAGGARNAAGLEQVPRVSRVFGQQQVRLRAGMRLARALRSCRLPIGVATRKSVPARGLPVESATLPFKRVSKGFRMLHVPLRSQQACPRRWPAALLCVLLGFAATTAYSQDSPSVTSAEALVRAGRHLEAAAQYERLAHRGFFRWDAGLALLARP